MELPAWRTGSRKPCTRLDVGLGDDLARGVACFGLGLTGAHADSVTERERGEAAVVIAAAKQRAIGTGLEIGSRVPEVTGARASANSVGLEIFWRNIRTHSLPDPVAYNRAEVGRYALLGELPEPTWYT